MTSLRLGTKLKIIERDILKTDVSKFEQISSIITQPGHDCLSFDVVFIIIIHCKWEIVVLNYVKLDVNFLSEISLIKPAPVKPYH